jgi:hypothetical protein
MLLGSQWVVLPWKEAELYVGFAWSVGAVVLLLLKSVYSHGYTDLSSEDVPREDGHHDDFVIPGI